MPELEDQLELPGVDTADFTVVRALLSKGRAYEQAVEAFEPYREVQEPNEAAREAMRQIAQRAMERQKPAFVFVNNRLEGNAPDDHRGRGGRDRGRFAGARWMNSDGADDKGGAVATTRADRQTGDSPAGRRGGDSPSLPGGHMPHDQFFAIDTSAKPWEERFNRSSARRSSARICMRTRRPAPRSGSYATRRGW